MSMICVKEAKVLVVGAGGIGCELLKNLVLDEFRDITIVDLDTIDISNLNRQFLFQKSHVGRSKAEVARESVLRFRSGVKVTAYHKSIFSSNFDVNFFSGFDLIFNALDNQAARRHVNRLCVATKRPLIESGTAGYLGQVEPFVFAAFPQRTEVNNGAASGDCTEAAAAGSQNQSTECDFRTGCYECQPRGAGQRSFPACTIRNTPSEPIHCVVWAKYLFNNLYGEPDLDDEDVSPDTSDPELQKRTAGNPDPESQDSTNGSNGTASSVGTVAMQNRPTTLRDWLQQKWSTSASVVDNAHNINASVPIAAQSLAWRLFHDDIVTLIGMRDLWVDRQDRREPTALTNEILDESIRMGEALPPISPQKRGSVDSSVPGLRDQRKLTTGGWLRLFMDSVSALQSRLTSDSTQTLTWDKDDDDAMDFVTGAAIVRAHLFHLPGAEELTRFTIKSLAGNIVPAIATTNAIVAGLMVLQARHILTRSTEHIRTIYLHRQPTGRRGNRRLVVPCEPPAPNPSCLVCSPEVTKSRLHLFCSPSSLTLRVLRDRILIRHLGMLAPDVELTERGLILISSEEGETDEATLNKSLADFHVIHGSHLQCDDFRQDFNLCLIVYAVPAAELQAAGDTADEQSGSQSTMAQDLAEGWRLVGNIQALTEAHEKPADDLSGKDVTTGSQSMKRAHTSTDRDVDLVELRSDSDAALPSKRARLSANSVEADQVVLADDDEDDLVLLD